MNSYETHLLIKTRAYLCTNYAAIYSKINIQIEKSEFKDRVYL
jgi:hypothetical protein